MERAQSMAFAEQQRQQELVAQKTAYQTTLRLYLMAAVTIFILALAVVFWRSNRRIKKANLTLQSQKTQIENTLRELKQTQTQLIQSEKMASLGELTAGIAHEIQNPLNFVNNFSEVNREMIGELKEELRKGDIEEALAIAEDISANEEKINHHGKRADFIVKGMLQHSRTSTGEKQLTDINVLADEFLRLSYHGLRAKDKNFNAELVTNFDEKLPKVNIAQQDIGRVLLNLFNNAFYAVNQKKKTAGADYKPTVEITTFAPPSGGWGAKVRDNGNGIPDAIKDKIMQPFFTTKPTGEGTGLGLSLSYDIVVKGHGGNITVDTKEGEFTEFTVMMPIN
jgi:signal transduction histidine kinase